MVTKICIRIVVVLALVATGLPVVAIPATAVDPVLVGAGDIGVCGKTKLNDEATATLLDGISGTVFTAGDGAYGDGTAAEFRDCYGPSWGRHKARTRPAPGNHEYHTAGASGYFGYFGSAAGEAGKGYYSYNLGTWHVIVLNSNCEDVACDANSAQLQWLRADLAANNVACTVAIWHHPLFSSGQHGGDATVKPFWDALYTAKADLILNGHDHDYERFAPQDPTGRANASLGIREFVVGTGGAGLRAFVSTEANSQVRNATTYGVLKLTLRSGSYDWQFVPVAAQTFTDSGTGQCVGGGNPPPPPPPIGQVLLNPSFELDANGNSRPDSWTSSSRFTRSNAIAAHQGSFVGRFLASDNSGDTINQKVTATAGSSYAFSCWTNIPTTGDSFTFKLEVRWLNASGGTIRTDLVKSYTDDTNGAWSQATRSLTAPTGTSQAQVRLVTASLNGTIYVDDCSFAA